MNNIQEPVSPRAQIISILGSLVLFGIIVYLIKKNRLKSGYSILWFFVSGIILVLSFFSNTLNLLSLLIGIFYAPAAIFAVLFVGLILINIHFSTILTDHEKKIKKLAQENGLLKEKVENILKKRRTKK